MLANDQMKSNRFARWHKARKKVAEIRSHLEMGHEVYICTYTRAVRYTKKHVEMFKATRTGAFVQRGKNWDCIDGCAIKAVW